MNSPDSDFVSLLVCLRTEAIVFVFVFCLRFMLRWASGGVHNDRNSELLLSIELILFYFYFFKLYYHRLLLREVIQYFAVRLGGNVSEEVCVDVSDFGLFLRFMRQHSPLI